MSGGGHWAVVLVLTSAVACAGKAAKNGKATSSDGAATGSGGSAGTMGAGGTSTDGASGSGGSSGSRQFITTDCLGDDDCASGNCRELVPGGYRVCVDVPKEAESCDRDDAPNECCSSDDCQEGRCLGFLGAYCTGDQVLPYNKCASDECNQAADCASLENGVCFPAGAYSYPVATCVAGGCRSDSDCVEEEGGRCVLYFDPCCELPSLACVYPSDGCQTQQDCIPDGCQGADCLVRGCMLVNGRARCTDTGVGCAD